MKQPLDPTVIALLTDYGTSDHYAGTLKGVILSLCPRAQIVDITHAIEPQNRIHGAFCLKQSWSYFPTGTIFVCAVDPGVGTMRKILCAQTPRAFFIGPDNGILEPALSDQKECPLVSITQAKYFYQNPPSATFHGRDIMASAAGHLALTSGSVFHQLGPSLKTLQKLACPKPLVSRTRIRGVILFFDHFGNAVTNIQKKDQPETFWNQAKVKAGKKSLGKLQKVYGTSRKELFALFNSSGHLEIASPCGSAKNYLSKTDPVFAEI